MPWQKSARRNGWTPSIVDAWQIANYAGLLTNLRVAIDPGVTLSYSGGGQVLNSVPQDFQLFAGADATATAADPTFNGSVGAATNNEYFSLDGGDYFTLNGSNPAWLETLHKDNAVYSLCVWAYAGAVGSIQTMIGDHGTSGAGRNGFRFGFDASGNLQVLVYANNSVSMTAVSSVALALLNEWALYMFTFDEAAGNRRASRGSAGAGYVTNLSGGFSYSPASTVTASYPLQIGAAGNALNPLMAGGRIGQVWMWDRALSDVELQTLFATSKSRYGM